MMADISIRYPISPLNLVAPCTPRQWVPGPNSLLRAPHVRTRSRMDRFRRQKAYNGVWSGFAILALKIYYISYKYFVAYTASSWRIFLNIIYSKNVKKKSRFERINLLLQFLKQCRTIQWPIFQPCKSERHFTCINSCNIYL